VHLAALQQLDVALTQRFGLQTILDLAHRRAPGPRHSRRASLESAVALNPVRARLSRAAERHSWPLRFLRRRKTSASQKLIDRAEKSGEKSLAAELRGRLALHRKKIPTPLPLSIRPSSWKQFATVHYALAASLMQRGEQAVLRKFSGRSSATGQPMTMPTRSFPEISGKGGPAQAIKILQNWLASDPTSVSARLLQINVYMQQIVSMPPIGSDTSASRRRRQSAVLAQAAQFFAAAHRPADFRKLLEDEVTQHPDNRAAVEWLINLYAQENRSADALRILDASALPSPPMPTSFTTSPISTIASSTSRRASRCFRMS